MRGCGSADWLVALASGSRVRGRGTAPTLTAAPAWSDVAWNPTAGCTPVGPGCNHCEASRTVAQLSRMGGKAGARYAGLTVQRHAGAQWTGEVRVRSDLLTWPLLQRRSRRVLVSSLSDLFHEKLETEILDTVHAVMTIAHWHSFVVLTRRAERMRSYYTDPQTPARVAGEVWRLAETLLQSGAAAPRARGEGAPPAATRRVGAGMHRYWAAGLARAIPPHVGGDGTETAPAPLDPWPLPNLWLGVSVEDQEHAGCIGQLLRTPAKFRWACLQPLLGRVRLDLVPVGDDGYANALSGDRNNLDGRSRCLPIMGPPWPRLDWVVVGGETGSGARPVDPDWVRELRDRCTDAGVPFLFEQWGEWAPVAEESFEPRLQRVGRRAAGRLIDGRSWDETPTSLRESPRRQR